MATGKQQVEHVTYITASGGTPPLASPLFERFMTEKKGYDWSICYDDKAPRYEMESPSGKPLADCAGVRVVVDTAPVVAAMYIAGEAAGHTHHRVYCKVCSLVRPVVGERLTLDKIPLIIGVIPKRELFYEFLCWRLEVGI